MSEDAPAPHIAMAVNIEDLGGSRRRVSVVQIRSGDEISADVDFLDGQDEQAVLGELLREAMTRWRATPEG